jgi:hypothetical protein
MMIRLIQTVTTHGSMLTICESVPIQQQGQALVELSYVIAALHIDIFKLRDLGRYSDIKFIDKTQLPVDAHRPLTLYNLQ